MRLDLSALKYMTNEDFRVLIAIEMGMRNHEVVPVDLIQSISKLKKGNVNKIIANLLKHKLIKHTNIQYDGYSLNYLGYDYLAIHSLIKQGILVKIGSKLGVGKESDVYFCYVKSTTNEISEEQYNQIKNDIYTENALIEVDDNNENEEDIDTTNNNNKINEEDIDNDNINIKVFSNLPKTITTNNNETLTLAVIKLARLGRTSFRAVKSKRDYVKNNTHYNWLYLSRLSSQNEFKYMKGLFSNKFNVPLPIGYNRHAIIMEYIPSFTLCKIEEMLNKDIIYRQLISFILNLASYGLVHGDFNEFNILIRNDVDNQICIIDFPQMISIDHPDAKDYFIRDIQCVKKFFIKKFNVTFDDEFVFEDIQRVSYLDRELGAFGAKKEKKEKSNNIDIDIDNDININNDIDNEDDKEDPKKEPENIDEELDFEKEKLEFENTKNPQKKKKTYTETEIKEKVRKMLTKSTKNNKLGNRYKGKKNMSTKVEIKHITK